MKGKSNPFQKKVSNRFISNHGKMVDKNNQPTGKPVVSELPTPLVRTPEEQAVHDQAMGIIPLEVVEEESSPQDIQEAH